MDFHRIRSPRLPFEQEYTTGGWNRESGKETCRCPSGLSSWFLVKETSIFCPGFYLRLKERMISIKNRGHPRGYCRRDRTQLLSNFSSCNFLLKPSICSSLDGYRRGACPAYSYSVRRPIRPFTISDDDDREVQSDATKSTFPSLPPLPGQ